MMPLLNKFPSVHFSPAESRKHTHTHTHTPLPPPPPMRVKDLGFINIVKDPQHVFTNTMKNSSKYVSFENKKEKLYIEKKVRDVNPSTRNTRQMKAQEHMSLTRNTRQVKAQEHMSLKNITIGMSL